MKFNAELFIKMREATALLQKEGPVAATAAIQRALQNAAGRDAAYAPAVDDVNTASDAYTAPNAAMRRARMMHDINPPIERPGATPQAHTGLLGKLKESLRSHMPRAISDILDIEDADIVEDRDDAAKAGKGRFIASACTTAAGTRGYKLYIPSTYCGTEGDPVPLIVILHGCKQDPDDFAAGTRMNEMAEKNNCLVVYPAQSRNANGSNCWNWFQPGDQQRDKGEPSIIAAIVRDISCRYHVDTRRVYAAGLSAGGAMAAVLGNTYPDLFAAIGIHSGLPHGVAHDVPSAFAVMQSGTPQASPMNAMGGRNAMDGMNAMPAMNGMSPMNMRNPLNSMNPVNAAHPANGTAPAGHSIPVIVFHGDADGTVHPRNGEQVLAQCVNGTASRQDAPRRDQVPGGHAYTCTVQYGSDGKAIAEKWIVHGAGHAWSGGSSKGSFTDPQGPDASKEMLRFFYSHAK